MAAAKYIELLSQYFSAWEHLSEDEQEAFLENTTLMHYKKGVTVHNVAALKFWTRRNSEVTLNKESDRSL